jgi:hypothetical protein
MMNNRNALDGLPMQLYLRSPLFYWWRLVRADRGRLAFGGKHYPEDFWFILNLGWHDMQP